MSSPAFDAFVAPARPRSALWRTALGGLLIVLIYAGSFAAAIGAVTWLLGGEAAYALLSELVQPEEARATLFLLATFVGMAAAPLAVVPLLHRRSPASLFGRAPVVLRDFVRCALSVGLVYAVLVGVWAVAFDARPNLSLGTWLALLPLTLLGVLVQTGAEELVFRGYLTQQLAARFRSRVVWMVVPSVLFGIVHYAPAIGGANTWILIVGATLFGLIAADLTAATGSIGAAWGFHFANNTFALGVLATDGTITGLALYHTPYAADAADHAQLALIADFGMLICAWVLCRLVVRR